MTSEVCVRIGLNAGEPIAEDDDFFGTAVQLAARIADRAEPGQVLVSNVVRELCAGKGFEFTPVGEATLKASTTQWRCSRCMAEEQSVSAGSATALSVRRYHPARFGTKGQGRCGVTKGRVVVVKEHRQPFVIEEYDVPDPEPGGIILKITQAGICGSDLHMWRGDQRATPLPPNGRVMGHEGTGVIARLGTGVTTDSLGKPIREGDRLMYAAIAPCNHCYQCLRGEHNWCSGSVAAREAGVFPYFVGTYADYYYLPADRPVFAVPTELPDEALGFVNCAMGTVTEGLLRAACSEGDYVVILGAGGLGLNATAMAKDMGAHKVIVLDRLDNRLALAEEFGADATINIEEFSTLETRRDRVWELTEGRGANIVMELVGRAELLVEGIDYLANGGTFVEIGDIVRGRTVELDPSTLLRGKKIIGSAMYRPRLLPLMMETLVKNQASVPYHKVVSNSYPLEQVNEAFADAEWNDRQTEVTRAMLVP